MRRSIASSASASLFRRSPLRRRRRRHALPRMTHCSTAASAAAPQTTMISLNGTIELLVDKPAAGGRMVARANGQVILVAGAIPGERVMARMQRMSKGVAFAETIAVVEPSPDRREPFVDPLCGGSLYSYIAYPRQLALKSEIIADAFRRIGRLELPGAVAVAPSPEEGYRMRARLHVRAHTLGFFREGTHEICGARATRQLLPASCDVLDRLSAAMRAATVLAVEGDPNAADDLHANGASANAKMTTVRGPVEGFTASAFRMLGRRRDSRPLVETVIVDPPRTGMSREALDAVLLTQAPRLVYVSCDVATLARDARRLVDA